MKDNPNQLIDVFELAKSGATAQGELTAASLPRLATELARPEGVLRYALHGYIDTLSRPAARLDLGGTVQLRCDRCGEPVAVPLDRVAQFFFVHSEAELARLPIFADDDEGSDDSEPLLGSERFVVAELVEDETLLSLPMSPKHEACNPAYESPELAQDADEEPTKRPFAVLAGLKQGFRKS